MYEWYITPFENEVIDRSFKDLTIWLSFKDNHHTDMFKLDPRNKNGFIESQTSIKNKNAPALPDKEAESDTNVGQRSTCQ